MGFDGQCGSSQLTGTAGGTRRRRGVLPRPAAHRGSPPALVLDHLDQVPALATEAEDVTAQWIAFEQLLYLQG